VTPTLRLALAGDTMLGRGVASAIRQRSARGLFGPRLIAAAREADLMLLNLECSISERGSRWPDPRKPFFFRAPPEAVEALTLLGVRCVTLANNHALDYGPQALLDTFAHLSAAGIAWAGAGPDRTRARAGVRIAAGDLNVTVVAVTDHPADYAAGADRPGVAFADLRREAPPDWLLDAVRRARDRADVVIVSPHWGPNMAPCPVPHVYTAASALVAAGATLVAGHSAHVFHGVSGPVLFDLGDFIDDYAVDPDLRNDLGLLWFATLKAGRCRRVEALPLRLWHCSTEVADERDAAWVRARFEAACRRLGTAPTWERNRLVVDLDGWARRGIPP
jgi:poly-gamma-glutamate synthesis protein (capsule biosynthesis protein)